LSPTPKGGCGEVSTPRCRYAQVGALSKYGFVMNDEHGATELGLVGEVPYYATIFTTRMTSNLDGYDETADRMAELVSAREGFLGMQSARGDDGLGITVCYGGPKRTSPLGEPTWNMRTPRTKAVVGGTPSTRSRWRG